MRFITLGPTGTCHENAAKHYLQHHGITDAELILVPDLLDGLEMLHDGMADYLIQNSAHLQVHIVTERYYREISVIDTFIYETREMALLEDASVEHPRTLGLMSATEGYLDGIDYEEIIYEPSKPVIAANFLAGKYDAALTHLFHYTDNPGRFRVRKYIGAVPTAWLVYGREKIYDGTVKGTLPVDYYARRIEQNAPLIQGEA